MKKYFKISFLLVLSLMLIQPAQGQKLLKKIADKAKEKVEQKVGERAEQSVDEKIDENIEDSEGDESSTSNSESAREAKMQARMQGLMKGMGMGGDPVPIADSYSFDHKVQMHIESYDESGQKISDGEFITHFDPKSKSMAYQVVSGNIGEKGQGMFIMDAENGATIILSEENGKKTGIVYGIGAFMQTMGESYDEEALEDSPDLYLANPNVKKTGKTKTISGFKCEEYVYTDPETESESDIWITKDMKLNSQDFFSTIFKTSLYSQGIGWGYMMEVSTKEKSGAKSMMQVTDVDSNSNIKFSMKDYQLTNLGSFTMPTEE